eukprot:GHVH01008655.1.p1 GENE.GHVH01008655.1~~GHVH01008655.1.p1  ORF type:complete len:194 (+),score=37.23 GHVH01008655.1:104-685(+)
MDTVLGFKGKDFVIVAADAFAASSIIRFKDDEEKILKVDDDKLIGISGPAADRMQFGEYIQANVHLNKHRTDMKLNVSDLANYTRSELAEALRKGPYQANCLVAGLDEGVPKLYWIDYLASMVEMDRGAHGYAAYFTLGLMDHYWKKDMNREEAMDLLNKCLVEIKTRFLLSQYKLTVKIITSTGIEEQILEI